MNFDLVLTLLIRKEKQYLFLFENNFTSACDDLVVVETPPAVVCSLIDEC